MKARRVDANHRQIVEIFRAMGCSVLDLSRVGQGCPDILVARGGQSRLIEIKDGAKPPSARRLTPQEREFHCSWKGGIQVVETVAQAILVANDL